MTNCEENIRCLIPRVKPPIIKPPMYRSNFTEFIKRSHQSNKECHRTMGYAKVKLNPPSEFLKKSRKKNVKPAIRTTKTNLIEDSEKQTPAIVCKISPKKKTTENKIRANIIDAIRKNPPMPKNQIQDTRNGHIMNIVPSYVKKKTYGKVPKYMVKFNKEMEQAKQREIERIQAIKPPLRILTTEERKELLNGLKKNWAELQKEYLLLPMLIDTVPKIRRKELLTVQLEQLEKDIDIMERNQDIHICQDV